MRASLASLSPVSLRRSPESPRRLRVVLLLCFLLSVFASACATESPPDPEIMSLREHLGLSSERVAALNADARAHFAQQLAQVWRQQALDAQGAQPPPDLLPSRDAISAEPPLSVIRAHDQTRAQQQQDALLSASLDPEPDGVHITALSLSPEQLGLSSPDGAMLHIAPLAEDEVVFAGELSFDSTWGTVEQPALGGLRERDAALSLDPLLRRALHHFSEDAAFVTVSPAPRAPLALWYSVDTQTLLINPNLLYLIHSAQPAASDPHPVRTQTAALELPFIETCINDQRLRCNQCFGPAGDPTLPQCAPLFPTSNDPTEAASQECLDLSTSNQFDLLCYHQSITSHLACFRSLDSAELCGASLAPFQSTLRLQLLTPIRSDEACQQYLLTCEDDSGSTSGTSGSTSGTTSGSTSGSTSGTTPTPIPTPAPQSSDETCSDDCSESLCDAGLQALVTIACLGLVDGSDSCDSSDSETTDTESESACSDESSEQQRNPSPLPQSALLAFPFAILAGAWWRDRRRSTKTPPNTQDKP
jgi:hypothetical protein